ncbi:MAG TPA: Rieske (2Fe-2S) protein [Gryllotalpicola sp.]
MSWIAKKNIAGAGRATGRLLARIEGAQQLDALGTTVQGLVKRVLPTGPVRDLLHGVPLGHPAHPFLVQIPLGAWMSAAVLDLVPGGERAARTLIGVGTAAAVPAAASGITDWSESHPAQRRVGLVHWGANLIAIGCYTLSFVQRVRGHTAAGKKLALLGLGVASVGGYLGGHLAYRQALGANHTESVPYLLPQGWQPVAALEDLPDGELTARMVGTVPVLLYRRGERVTALADACAHLAGPLHEGEIAEDAELGLCVTCPWHGSGFSLEDGAVVHGPATSPQPVFDTRVRQGQVQVALA